MKAGQRCVPPGGRYLNHPTLIRDPGQTVSRAKVEALAARTSGTTLFLCGSVENEDDVGDLFDLVVCLVVDEETLIRRLVSRTTNAFGSQPEELAAALEANETAESAYRRLGASIIDATQPVALVADAVRLMLLTAAGPTVGERDKASRPTRVLTLCDG